MDIINKLLPYQVPHTLQLYECLLDRNRVLDASDTGTGKTYCALAACKMLGYKPFIICPKSVLSTWIETCKYFDLNILGIANYELIKGCKYYTEDYEVVNCPYMDKEVNQVVDEKTGKESKEYKYIFYLPKDTLVIFDEAHRCKNSNTETSRLLIALNNNQIKIMLLSATITDKIDCFRPFGVIFGFYKDILGFKPWMRNKFKFIKNYNIKDENQVKLKIIHDSIFPYYGSRMKIVELGDLFPQNNITAACYYLQNHVIVKKLYEEINQALLDLHDKEKRAVALGKLIRARQKVEMLKVPLFIDLAHEGLDSGFSIVIFVNYIETLENLAKELHEYNPQFIKGGQSIDERNLAINNFQSNKNKLIIAMCQAGNVGISLHDLKGGHPRMSIISPTWSGQDMKQILGRIHRAGSKSPAIQKIVYVAKTYEEEICKLIRNKISNIDAINDNDLLATKISKEELFEINKSNEPSEYLKSNKVLEL